MFVYFDNFGEIFGFYDCVKLHITLFYNIFYIFNNVKSKKLKENKINNYEKIILKSKFFVLKQFKQIKDEREFSWAIKHKENKYAYPYIKNII